MTLEFHKPVCELIRMRKSARTHTGETIAPDILEQLTESCNRLDRGLVGEEARFKVLEKSFIKGAKVKLGNYGLQKNPRYFFAGAVKKSDMARESYGYLMEQLILKATDLGLGTCWIGFFDRKFFFDFKIEHDEIFPATCTVGHMADRRLFEKISRAAVRADQRKSPEALFFDGSFDTPLSLADGTPEQEVLEMVRLAPSSGNSQPWRIIKEKDSPTWHFFLKKIKTMYFKAGLHHIDMGIAMCHFELAAGELGIAGQWRQSPPDLTEIPTDTYYTMSWIGS